MPMKNENYYIALSQILLVDPASETPRIHSSRKNISKRQLIRRLELLVMEFEDNEVEIDLAPYNDTIAYLKKIRTDREYEDLIQEVVDSYDTDFGVEVNPEISIDHTWSAQENRIDRTQHEQNENTNLEKKKTQSF
ncbi:hypothetical protein [Enterococcus sp. DIV0187]|uniref:hypothetical protein n=1 Tax=Enterococcus sp. DIV0187 TaxID=2774644 RepID=UPI003F269BDB